MPQLDKVTFLSQFFWLSFFYLTFYFLILKNFLPKMSRILKFRKKKSQKSIEDPTGTQKDHFDQIVSKCLNRSKNLFTENMEKTYIWLNTIKNSTNKTHYLTLNKTYIQSVGETFLADNLPFSYYSSKKSKKIFTELLLSKIKNK